MDKNYLLPMSTPDSSGLSSLSNEEYVQDEDGASSEASNGDVGNVRLLHWYLAHSRSRFP